MGASGGAQTGGCSGEVLELVGQMAELHPSGAGGTSGAPSDNGLRPSNCRQGNYCDLP